MQTALVADHRDTPEDKRFAFRMGINLGEIVDDNEDIYGDGVNIAARIESMAEPGGIWISANVHEQVHKKVNIPFQEMGEQTMKNVSRPIRTYRVVLDDECHDRPGAVVTALTLPDRPSIAVLPFQNMSGDPEQDYFSDGISEDVITTLSRFTDLFVIARNSSFTYRGTSVDVRQVGRELGVRYVLEGSVRRAGDQVRITAQLIEAETGSHIWADRYDRKIDDIFAIQDEITERVSGAVGGEIYLAATDRAVQRDKRDLGARELVMRAQWHANRVTEEGFAEARELCLSATQQFPNYAGGYSVLAYVNVGEMIWGWGPAQSPADASRAAAEAAQAAIAIDSNDQMVLFGVEY